MTDDKNVPTEGLMPKVIRGGMQVASAIPYVGGVLSAAAGAWSENQQEKVNRFFKEWIKMLEDEIREKEKTIIEIMTRLDINDEKIVERIQSQEYQSLLKKTFREWAGAESEEKRIYLRNILANAAGTSLQSDDVIRMFVDWIGQYSETHFKVIGAIYNTGGISRGEIWDKIGKGQVREDSADADLYKLLFRDLTMGSIIRQHRATTYDGRFIKQNKTGTRSSSREFVSAFDRNEKYELTNLGEQFVHYAMTDLPPKIEYKSSVSD